MALTSASNTLQSLSAMQRLGSAAHSDKSLMRTCKQEAGLWKELMASFDSPTESHLPSRDCMRQQLAASVLFVPYMKQTQFCCYFPLFPPTSSPFSTCCRAALFSPQLDELTRTGNQLPPVLCANCSSGSRRNLYLQHKQSGGTFNLATLGIFSILWHSQRTPHHHQSR